MKKKAVAIYIAEQALFLNSIKAAANGANIIDYVTPGHGVGWGEEARYVRIQDKITRALWFVMGSVRHLEKDNAYARSLKSGAFGDNEGSSQSDEPFKLSKSFIYVQNMDSIIVENIGEDGKVEGSVLVSRLTVKMVENWKSRLEGRDNELDGHLDTIMGGVISANPGGVDDVVAGLERRVEAQRNIIAALEGEVATMEERITKLNRTVVRYTGGVTANLGASLARDSQPRPRSAGS